MKNIMLPKVSLIGAGNVGGMSAMRIANSGIADCVLVDIAVNVAKAKQLDLEDSGAILKSNAKIFGTDNLDEIKDSSIVVITAGFPRKPGMTREDLLKANSNVLKDICSKIRDNVKDSIVIAVTNPLDIMTFFLYKELKLKREKLFGMGGTLDSGRFANLIASEFQVPNKDVNALVIGAHDNTMVPLPRFSQIKSKNITTFGKSLDNVLDNTINRGASIVSLYGSGSAYFAPSAAVFKIIEAIITNKKLETSASVYLEGEYGLKDLFIGVPVIIDKSGISKIIELNLNEEESTRFNKSADAVKVNLEALKKCLI
jgi:malate dehydrogenase